MFALVLGCLDVVAAAALHRVYLADEATGRAVGTGSGATAQPATPESPSGSDDGWALCQTRFEGEPVEPGTVAITYLDPGVDNAVLPTEIRGWFGSVPLATVDVYKLESRWGQRRIALEISRSKWPLWNQVANGLEGKAMCSAVRAALRAAQVGRPRPPGSTGADAVGADASRTPGGAELLDIRDPGVGESTSADDVNAQRSRHDFEFIYARRPKMYRTIEWVGPLSHALELDRFVELRQWLERERQ